MAKHIAVGKNKNKETSKYNFKWEKLQKHHVYVMLVCTKKLTKYYIWVHIQ